MIEESEDLAVALASGTAPDISPQELNDVLIAVVAMIGTYIIAKHNKAKLDNAAFMRDLADQVAVLVHYASKGEDDETAREKGEQS